MTLCVGREILQRCHAGCLDGQGTCDNLLHRLTVDNKNSQLRVEAGFFFVNTLQ